MAFVPLLRILLTRVCDVSCFIKVVYVCCLMAVGVVPLDFWNVLDQHIGCQDRILKVIENVSCPRSSHKFPDRSSL